MAEATPIRNDGLLEAIHRVQKEASTENIVKMFNEVVVAEMLAPISLMCFWKKTRLSALN